VERAIKKKVIISFSKIEKFLFSCCPKENIDTIKINIKKNLPKYSIFKKLFFQKKAQTYEPR
jgi:hypothetical protein